MQKSIDYETHTHKDLFGCKHLIYDVFPNVAPLVLELIPKY